MTRDLATSRTRYFWDQTLRPPTPEIRYSEITCHISRLRRTPCKSFPGRRVSRSRDLALRETGIFHRELPIYLTHGQVAIFVILLDNLSR